MGHVRIVVALCAMLLVSACSTKAPSRAEVADKALLVAANVVKVAAKSGETALNLCVQLAGDQVARAECADRAQPIKDGLQQGLQLLSVARALSASNAPEIEVMTKIREADTAIGAAGSLPQP